MNFAVLGIDPAPHGISATRKNETSAPFSAIRKLQLYRLPARETGPPSADEFMLLVGGQLLA
jgi:hypothetical protein